MKWGLFDWAARLLSSEEQEWEQEWEETRVLRGSKKAEADIFRAGKETRAGQCIRKANGRDKHTC